MQQTFIHVLKLKRMKDLKNLENIETISDEMMNEIEGACAESCSAQCLKKKAYNGNNNGNTESPGSTSGNN